MEESCKARRRGEREGSRGGIQTKLVGRQCRRGKRGRLSVYERREGGKVWEILTHPGLFASSFCDLTQAVLLYGSCEECLGL